MGGIYSISDKFAIAVGANATILAFKDNSWSNYVHNITTSNLKAVYLQDESNGWIIGDNTTIIKYYNNIFEKYNSPILNNINYLSLNSIAMIDFNSGWIVGGGGLILYCNNGEWTAPESSLFLTHTSLGAISLADINNGYAGGGKGALLKLKDGIWNIAENDNIQSSISTINLIDNNTGWMSATGLYYCSGGKFVAYPGFTNEVINSIQMISEREAWAVGNNGIILYGFIK